MRFYRLGPTVSQGFMCSKAVSPGDELYTLSEHTKPSARRDKSPVCIAGVRPARTPTSLYEDSSDRKREGLAQSRDRKSAAIAGRVSFDWSSLRYLLLSWRLLRDHCTFSGAVEVRSSRTRMRNC